MMSKFLDIFKASGTPETLLQKEHKDFYDAMRYGMLPSEPPSTATEVKARMENAMARIGGMMPMSSPMMPQDALVGRSRPYDSGPHPMDMIAMRLHIPNGERINLQFISAYVSDKVAYVFVVDNHGKHVTLEDTPDLFPSDALITSLRLIIG